MVRKAADQGVPEAQFNLGKCHQEGQGVDADALEAFKWFDLAAKQGLPQAQHELALCYHHGRGTEPDLREASKWSQMAAAQSYPPAEAEKEELEQALAEMEKADPPGQESV